MNLQNDKYGIKAFNHKNILIVVGFVGLLTITCSILPRQGEGEKKGIYQPNAQFNSNRFYNNRTGYQ